jgi:hypothetical protein
MSRQIPMDSTRFKAIATRLASARVITLLWLLLAASMLTLIVADQLAKQHGLRLTLDGEDAGHTAQAFLDGNSFEYDKPVQAALSGYVWAARPGTYTLTVRTDGGVRITLDGAVVLDADDKTTPRPLTATVDLQAGAIPLDIRYTHTPGASLRPLVDLWWTPPGGVSHRVPRAVLFTSQPGPDRAASAQGLSLASGLAKAGLWLALVALAAAHVIRVVSSGVGWRTVTGLLAVFALALALRVVFIAQRAPADSAFFMLPLQSDQRAYEFQARGLATGDFPGDGPYYRQPGIAYALYGLHLIAGPDIPWVRIATSALGALGAVIAYLLACTLFDRRAGWPAAIMTVLYPPFVFYSGTGLITPVAIFVATALLWQAVTLLRRPSFPSALATGLLMGAAIVTRQNLMTFLPFAAAAPVVSEVILRRRDRLAADGTPAPGESFPPAVSGRVPRVVVLVWLGVVVIVASLVVVLPFTLHNYRSGTPTLVSTAGPSQFYLGNNRDATGTYQSTQAWQEARLLHKTYRQAFLDDVRAEPMRWVQLMAHKMGLFWQGDELVTNLSYYDNGVHVSSLLAALRPFNLTVLALLGLSGGLLALLEWRRGPWLIWMYILATTASAVAFTPDSRIRAPTVPALVPFAALALVWAYDTLRLRFERKRTLQMAGAAAVAGAFLGLCGLANHWLPLPRLIDQADLPQDVILLDQIYGENIRLVGFRARGDTDLQAREPLTLTLYWQRLAPIDRDYSVFLHLIGRDGRVLGQKDIPVGLVSYQYYPMTQWDDDRIFVEEYMIVSDGSGQPLAADMWVGVYDRDTLERLTLADGTTDTTAIHTVRVSPAEPPPATEPAVPTQYQFGGWAALSGYDIQQTPEQITLSVHWSVESTPPANYSAFVHLISPDGEMVAQGDAPPMDNLLPTGLWRAGDHLVDSYQIDLPLALPPGEYTIMIGLYDAAGRVPASGADGSALPDAAVPLAVVTLP